jgi:ElaB/YqjD/DUF883 family membrane-anchored ribosome-binding protein
MTDNPDQIREDIERTRSELGSDVDALADKVRPSSILNRRAHRVRSALASMKDTVIGVASDVKDNAAGAVSSVGTSVAEAPRAAARQTQGHPIGVGLIAFGVGLLASSLIPASQREREMARDVRQRVEPLRQELSGAARDVANNLREPAQEAMESVKVSAREAVDTVKNEASSAKQDVKSTAATAGEPMGGETMNRDYTTPNPDDTSRGDWNRGNPAGV